MGLKDSIGDVPWTTYEINLKKKSINTTLAEIILLTMQNRQERKAKR